METSPQSALDCYWVVPGNLLAGEYPARETSVNAVRRLDALLGAGMQVFIDLTEPDELPAYMKLLTERAAAHAVAISHQRFPIVDLGLPTREQMIAILDCIDASIAAGRRVYVHCWGGIGRTGMVVACYLVRRGLDAPHALDKITKGWCTSGRRGSIPRSPETPAQMQFVLDWSEHG